jgi:hypothetical protein
MKKIFLSTAIALLFLQSCKDEDVSPTTSAPAISIVTSPGSYWVYQWYDIDTAGNETINRYSDSIYIAGDTAINGNLYVIFTGTELGSPNVSYLRDSASYVVASTGKILWNTSKIGEISTYTNDIITATSSTSNLSKNVQVAGENYTAIERMTTYCKTNGSPMNPCEQCSTFKAYFANGIGEVMRQTAYIGSCNKLERRLVRYEIK